MDYWIDDSDQLKLCPFCGAVAEIVTLEGEDGDVGIGAQCVQCTACGSASGLIYPLMDDVTNLLYERWNRRQNGIKMEWQPIEIEQLQAKVAELEEENARLKAECDDIKQVQFPRKLEAVTVGWKKQLAAEQLNNKLLRDALQEYIDEHEECQDADDWMAMMCSMEAHHTADEALSQPSDTSALDTFVAEKVKEATATQKEYYEGVFQDGSKQIAKAFRQRDLAVEALENCRLLAARHRKEEWAGHIMRFCKDAGLSGSPIRNDSIKESEAK